MKSRRDEEEEEEPWYKKYNTVFTDQSEDRNMLLKITDRYEAMKVLLK